MKAGLMNQMESLEEIWGDLLSRNPVSITEVFSRLNPDSQRDVLNHLRAMISEKGWHQKQKRSARIALNSIKTNFPEMVG
jgi:hypothetical protein